MPIKRVLSSYLQQLSQIALISGSLMREERNSCQGSVNIYWTEKVLKFELQNSVKYYVFYIKYICTLWGIIINKLTFGTGVLHLFQINHQLDATIFQFIILTFVYSSTCFGCFPAYHQELNDCSGSLWFYLGMVVIVVLCSWPGRPARPQTAARLSPRYEGKTGGCHWSHWVPDDGRENTRNMLSCKQTSG